ncbi:MAG: 3-isopropylmalate dehydratase small subunit [Dethiobacter sp.]|nr:3-isopropylmalate dehydratase small subunit [Dethiobacter sp.]
MKLEGRTWLFGDNIDTDAIIPARYLTTTDPVELARFCMEDADPRFAGQVRPGDFVVAGKNFGCGSSREHAPLALKGAGVGCVIANSFAQIFFRNAVNIGLPILECEADLPGLLLPGEILQIDLARGQIVRLADGRMFASPPLPSFMQEIIKYGGLIECVQARLKKMD